MKSIGDTMVPDSAMARAATELIRDAESQLLFDHSARVFLFGACIGEYRDWAFDTELFYISAMFHGVGLTALHRNSQERFEIDSANAAREFLKGYGARASDIADVWDAIALHTTPGIPEHKSTVAALVAAGVETDLFGAHLDEFSAGQLSLILDAHPREPGFKLKLIEILALSLSGRPRHPSDCVIGDVLEYYDPRYKRLNFCQRLLTSKWPD